MTADPTSVATCELAAMEQAWNAADGAAYAASFAEDADFVNIRGAYVQGATAVGRGHQEIFDSIYKGSTVRYELETARALESGCVVALAAATLDVPTGPMQGVNHARLMLVMSTHEGGWLVDAFHNTLVHGDH